MHRGDSLADRQLREQRNTSARQLTPSDLESFRANEVIGGSLWVAVDHYRNRVYYRVAVSLPLLPPGHWELPRSGGNHANVVILRDCLCALLTLLGIYEPVEPRQVDSGEWILFEDGPFALVYFGDKDASRHSVDDAYCDVRVKTLRGMHSVMDEYDRVWDFGQRMIERHRAAERRGLGQ